MKLALKDNEHLRLEHDGGRGFQVWVDGNTIHIRAKAEDEPQADTTTLVLESKVEVSR